MLARVGSSQSVAVLDKAFLFFDTLPPSSIKRAEAEVRIERQGHVICGVLSPWGGQNSNASVFFGVVSPLGSLGDRRPDVLGPLRGALE